MNYENTDDQQVSSVVTLLCRIWLWLGCCCAIWWGQAAMAETTWPLTVTPLQAHTREHMLQHLQIFRDPGHQWNVDDLARQVQTANPVLSRSINLGFSSDAIWIRFDLVRENEQAPKRWWLVVQQPLFNDVTLYVPQADGSFSALPGRLPIEQRPNTFDDRLPSFELTLDDLHPRTYYLRVVTQTALSADLVIAQPVFIAHQEALARFIWGASFGAYLLMVLFYGVYSAWTRERLHLLYTFHLSANMVASFFTSGWARQILPPISEQAHLIWLGLSICLSASAVTMFNVEFLQIRSGWIQVVFRWLTRFSLGLILPALVLIQIGHYGWVMSIVQPFLLCVLALNLGFAFWRLFHRDHLARFFLLAFGPFYISVSWRFLQNNGWIEHGFWGNHAYQIGAFVHMLVMSAGVLTLYTRMRQEKEKVEYRLHSENLLRRQQADFLGMVSHEFRTPLSIIASTSENLLIDRDLTSAARLRVDKIIRANKRLYALMDEYLSHERLMTGTAKQEYQAIDLALLARRVHSELVDAEGPPIAMQVDAPVQVIGDAELLRVAIQNLVTNARRHSPPGSAIRVRVSQQMDQAELLVEDEGSGVPEHERPHIFDKFYRGGNTMDKPGAGMGLYLVKSIVEQHQGSIEQRNLSPQGCQFIIRIPLQSQFRAL